MKKRLLTTLLYMLCGALCALPAVIGELWIFGWIGFVPVAVCEYMREADTKRPYFRAWKRGFSFIYAYGLVTFYWFIELYPLDFVGLTPAAALGVVLLAWLGIPLLQSITGSFIIVFICFFIRKKAPLLLYPFACASIWTVCEWTHTLTWAGVPWGKLALGQTERLVNIQSASLLGSYFVGFLMILVSGLIAVSVIKLSNKNSLKGSVAAFICAILVFEANSIYGVIALNNVSDHEQTVTAAAIQGNIASDEKWSSSETSSIEVYKVLTEDAAREGAQLIVWPETALPYRLEENGWLSDLLCDIANNTDTTIIAGCFKSNEEHIYNATVLVTPDGISPDYYAKRHLVPFGEYVPLRKLVTAIFPPLADISMLSSDLTPGDSSAIFETEFGKLGSLICFDSIYEVLSLSSVRDGAELLCISTNDSWFHDSSATYEHNAHAKLRSVETGRYTVRAANTGISSIITDKGVEIDMFPALETGFARGEVKLISENTLYTQLGNLLVYICIAAILVFTVFYIIRDLKNGYNHRQKRLGEKHTSAASQ